MKGHVPEKDGILACLLMAELVATERKPLLRILKETRGRVGGVNGAAARMGVKRTTLISRLKKLDIDPRAVS